MWAGIIEGIARAIKVFFGMDKPHEEKIDDGGSSPDSLRATDDELLADFGVRVDPGAEGSDEDAGS